MRARWMTVLVACFAAVVPAAARAASTAPTPASSPSQPVALSNESTFTRWARVTHLSNVYQQPDLASPLAGRLHLLTEDGFSEVYLLLAATRDASGRQWVKLRLPGRPNGRVGWVPRATLGPFHITTQLLIVDRRRLRLSVYDGGHLRYRAPVAIGKPSSPTPAGHFWIREVFKLTNPRSGYYPYAFGTADYSTLTDWPGGGVVGIHGPYYQPRLIPGRISHGCIRLRVRDDAWLGTHLSVGTPLLID